jgi:hypothetical protein
MHGRLLRNLLLIALTASLTVATAGAATTARQRTASPPAPAKPAFAPNQIEAYLTEDTIGYIRPGLKIKVNSVTIGT